MHMCHMCVWCLLQAEEDIWTPGTALTAVVSPPTPMWVLGAEPGLFARTPCTVRLGASSAPAPTVAVSSLL